MNNKTALCTPPRRGLMIALVSAALALAASTGWASDEAAQDAEAKSIKIRGDSGLRLEIEMDKTRFEVNEPISFKVRGNQRFYLYVYTVDERDDAVMLLPNRFQGKDEIEYGPERWHEIPNDEFELYADEPGREKVVVIASPKYLRVGTRSSYKKLGEYWSSKAADFESEFEEKGIKVRGSEGKRGDAVWHKFDLRIVD